MNLERPAAGLDRDALLGEKTAEPELRDWEEVAGTIDPAAYLESLDRELDRLERQGDDKIVARRFFSELDREANPILLQGMVRLGRIHREDADQRRVTIKIVSNELRERLRIRGQWPDDGAEAEARIAERPIERLEAKCRYVSRLVLDLIDRHFGAELDEVARALQWFVSGDLRVSLPGGLATVQPSSANYLLLHEFGRLASVLSAEPTRWLQLVPILSRQEGIALMQTGGAFAVQLSTLVQNWRPIKCPF